MRSAWAARHPHAGAAALYAASVRSSTAVPAKPSLSGPAPRGRVYTSRFAGAAVPRHLPLSHRYLAEWRASSSPPLLAVHSVDGEARGGPLSAGANGHTLGGFALLILALAVLHGLARLGSRFAMIGAGQWVERDVRRDLYASFLRRPPAFYHTHRTGDLMSRATSDVSNVRALAGFGGTMLVATTLAFAGTLAAMWSIDPWLTLWALSPSPLLVLATKRFSHAVDEQSVAVQEQLGVLSAKVQENLTGMPVVLAYTMEAREIESSAG